MCTGLNLDNQLETDVSIYELRGMVDLINKLSIEIAVHENIYMENEIRD